MVRLFVGRDFRVDGRERASLMVRQPRRRRAPSTRSRALADIRGRPVIDRGRVFAVSHGGRMAAIDLRSGDRVWEQDIGGTHGALGRGRLRLCAVSNDDELVCLTRDDGKVRWLQQLPRYEDPKKKAGPDRLVRADPRRRPVDRLVLGRDRRCRSRPIPARRCGAKEIPGSAFVTRSIADNTLYILTDDARAHRLCAEPIVSPGAPSDELCHRHPRPPECRQIDAVQPAGRQSGGAGRPHAGADPRPPRGRGHGSPASRFRAIDTAGLEEAAPAALAAACRRQTERALADADVALFVIDARDGRHRSSTAISRTGCAGRQAGSAGRQQGRGSRRLGRVGGSVSRSVSASRCRSPPSMARGWPGFTSALAPFRREHRIAAATVGNEPPKRLHLAIVGRPMSASRP